MDNTTRSSTEFTESEEFRSILENGLYISGKKCKIVPYQPKEYIDQDGNVRIYQSFIIKDSHKAILKHPILDCPITFTQNITKERFESLIARFEKIDHMESVEFVGRIASTNNLLYVLIPEALTEWANILVDDSVSIKVTRKDGISNEDIQYSISSMHKAKIIHLTRLRRLALNENGKLEYVPIKDFKKTDQDKLFIKNRDVVKIELVPEPNYQNFDFAENMDYEISKLIKRSKKDLLNE